MARDNNLKNFVFSKELELTTKKKDFSYLPLSKIVRNKYQPRRYFALDRLEAMSESIKQYGILEPLIVRPLGDGSYELVAGERRYLAAKRAGKTEAPVSIRELSDTEALAIAIVENLQREDLNPLEETEGILELLAVKENLTKVEVISSLYRMNNIVKGNITPDNPNVGVNSFARSVEDLFNSLGRMSWESFVKNKLPLLKLPIEIIDELRVGKIEYTKALTIAKVKDEEMRKELLTEAIATSLSLSEIKSRIERFKSKSDKKSPVSPSARIRDVTQKVSRSKVWKDPKKWKKVERLLKQLEVLVEPEEINN